MDKEKPSEVISNGDILLWMKNQFVLENTAENFTTMLCFLRNTSVVVPVRVNLSKHDKKKLDGAEKGERVSNDDPVHMIPDILKNPDGKKYFPVFSCEKQMPDDYRKDFSNAVIPFMECVASFEESKDNLDGIVLDAFTVPVILNRDIIEIAKKLPSNNPKQN